MITRKKVQTALGQVLRLPPAHPKVLVLLLLLHPTPSRLVLPRAPIGHRWRWAAARGRLAPAVAERVLTELAEEPELVTFVNHQQNGQDGQVLTATEALQAAVAQVLREPPPRRPARGGRAGDGPPVAEELRHLESQGQERLPGFWRAA